MNLVITELSESDAVNRATERKCGGDEMGTEDPAAMLFLCSPAQGLLFPTYCHGGWFTAHFIVSELDACRVFICLVLLIFRVCVWEGCVL